MRLPVSSTKGIWHLHDAEQDRDSQEADKPERVAEQVQEPKWVISRLQDSIVKVLWPRYNTDVQLYLFYFILHDR